MIRGIYKRIGLFLLLIILGIMLYHKVRQDHTSVSLDSYAVPIVQEYASEERMEEQNRDRDPEENSVTVVCAQNLTVHTETGKVSLFYQNPYTSTHGVKVNLYAENQLLASSDVIPPGYQITEMDLVGELRAEEGVYPAKMEMVFVDTETGASVNIDSGMDVSIRVEN